MNKRHFKNNLINKELNRIADLVGVNKSKFKRKLKTFNKKDLKDLKEALGSGNLYIRNGGSGIPRTSTAPVPSKQIKN